MSEVLKSFSTQVLATAIEANVIEQFLTIFAYSPQVEIHDEPDTVWVVTDICHGSSMSVS